MDNIETEGKIYYGIFNDDPKMIAKRLKRPKAPMPTLMYNLFKFHEDINLLILTHVKKP